MAGTEKKVVPLYTASSRFLRPSTAMVTKSRIWEQEKKKNKINELEERVREREKET